VGFNLSRLHDVNDVPAQGDKTVSEDAAVAAPGQDFGAHDGGSPLRGESRQVVEGGGELVGQQ
jgi:hypothetical protein